MRTGLLRRGLPIAAACLVSLGFLAACGGGDSDDGKEVIRFSFAPDPVMKYLVDNGTVAELEKKWDVKLEMTEAFDEFAFFAGGHGDVVSTSSHEVAALEQETGIKTVTFGKYNHNHLQMLVQSDSQYQTMEDLKGKKIVVGSEGSMATWGAWTKEKYGLDFTFENGDYEIVLNNHAANPELLARGQVAACLCPTELAAPQHADGDVRALYDATMSEIWRDEFDHYGVMQNVFTATEKFYDEHPRAIAFFLDLWEKGIQQWHANFEDIIREYPADFNVKDPEDIDWVIDYLDEHDWNVDSVYFDQAWVDGEQAFISGLKDTGFLEKDLPTTRFEVWTPELVEEQLASTEAS